ncbi:MAG TPA: DinB family protein [Bryobacteraceae bacterium]|nr:DinB family protein [Acidobacteriaceae bacterium]HUB33025.1 DinB family protein [Bryobacteraceae bacterium]
MRPEEADFLRAYLLPQLRSEQSVTRRILAAIPIGQEEYRPHEKNWTALRLARHLAGTEMWFLHAVIHGQFVDGQGPSGEVRTGAAMAAWYEEQAARRTAQIEALPGDQLAAPVNWLGLRNDPAVTYLSLAIRHTVHHRGQLSAYLRPMGAKVPAIYVASADEPFEASPEEIASGAVPRPPAF